MRRVGQALLVLLLLAAGGLWWLLATHGGSAWLLQTLAARGAGGTQITIGRVQGRLLGGLNLSALALQGKGFALRIEGLRLDWRPWALLQGRLWIEDLLVDGLAIDYQGQGEASPEQGPPGALQLPLALQLDRLVITHIRYHQGTTRQAIESIMLSLTGSRDQLQVKRLRLRHPRGELGLRGALALTPPFSFDAQLEADAKDRRLGPIHLGSRLTGDLRGLRLKGALERPYRLDFSGTLDYEQGLGFDLNCTWRDLRWPLQGRPAWRSEAGRLQLRGGLDGYEFSLAGDLQGAAAPPLEIALGGQGDRASLRLTSGDIKVLRGRLSPRGELAWSPAPRWRIDLSARAIDPGSYWPGWPGNLQAQARLAGDLEGGQTRLRISLSQLAGRLRGYSIEGGGELQRRIDGWNIPQARFSLGENRLSLKGQIGKRLALEWKLVADDLEQLLPGARGHLQGAGRLRGRPDAPDLEAALEGRELGYGDYALAGLETRLAWSGEAIGLDAVLTRLRIADAPRADLRLGLHGSQRQHRLQAKLQWPHGELDLGARGGWRDGVWRGAIQSIDLQARPQGDWRLQRPVPLSYQGGLARLGRLCLRQQTASLCAAGHWRSERELALEARLEQFPIALLVHPFAPQLQVDGRLAGGLRLSGSSARPQLEAHLSSPGGVIQLPLDQLDQEPLKIAYRAFDSRLGWRDDILDSRLSMDLAETGQVRAELGLGAADAKGVRALSGQARLHFADLKLLEGFFPQLYDLRGSLDMQARLTGSQRQPGLELQAAVKDVSARLPDLGLKLHDLQLQASSQDERNIELTGQVESGGGRLRLSGRVALQGASRPHWRLRLQGKGFQVARLPEADVWASPDLRLHDRGDGLIVDGSLLLPRAIVSLGEIHSSGVTPSSDEVIVAPGQANAAEAPKADLLHSARIALQLGEAVSFQGYGLKARMQGALDLRYADDRPLGFGALELRDGSYRAYGQDLTIDKGRFLFSGPLDNPALDLAAYRLSEDGEVKAWLKVGGDLRQPNLKVSSEPAMPDDEAMSYLLTGKGLDAAGGSEALTAKLLTSRLGLAGGGALLKRIREESPLDKLELKTGENLQEISLLLGKQINPRLYVGYTLGLFDETGFAQLRLKLSRRLELETLSGSKQSVDLYYTLEHN